MSSGSFIGSNGAKSLFLQTNNANRITILSDGNVGIGTTTPSTALDVNGSINISGSGASLIFPDGTTLDSNSSLGGGNADYQFGANEFNGSGKFTTTGIGTFGTFNVTGISYLDDVKISTNVVNTTSGNVTITSIGGSVIIRLG